MEAHGPHAEQAIECRRQHVLTGVLLHVIEAAWPVDDAVRVLANMQRRSLLRPGPSKLGPYTYTFKDVQNVAGVIVLDVDDADAAERADVERLAARCGIERGAIEHGHGPAVARLDARHDAVELPGVRVGVIQTLRHGDGAAGSSKKNVAPPQSLPE